ncbi:poly(rC)-binding 4-like [Olea europaea subsp. europaea]|uniref:Poly(RC)-binding 4-like n=1 Tax=Olea europaea subsp. europaea TaxID=158383 RepID=A0A8S0VEQ4_OLEEU|nr:poly(rC)-binding 4-like [Olea europaea subsp. europaea]
MRHVTPGKTLDIAPSGVISRSVISLSPFPLPMAQLETQINPNPSPNPNTDTSLLVASEPFPDQPPSSATVTSDHPSGSTTAFNTRNNLKRPREEDTVVDDAAKTSTDVPAPKRRVKATHDVIYRIVVPSRQIGKVIGRVGHRIQKIREDTKAAIKIADAISRHEERVIIISSKDSDNVFSDAENALHQIVSLILKDDEGNVEAVKVGAGHVAANTVRLLIAGTQAGGLIGVSGQNIENLRNSSGATITVLSPNQLPPCASAHESDRVVQVAGDIPSVLRAVVEIGCQLRDNPPKQVISISPSYNPKPGFPRPAQHHVDPTSAEYVNLDLMVPENLVGGLIGRFGANISRIRNESGATIKVYGGRGEQSQRQIHLGGSAQQVALAKQRVDEYVYAELMRQAGGQLPQAASQLQQVATQQTMPDMSNTLYQGYDHAHAFYANSNYEAGMMTSVPTLYAPTATNQGPPYYDHQTYNEPPL